MKDVGEEFKIEVITQLERLIEKGTEVFSPRGDHSGPEHILCILPRVLEIIRVIHVLNKCLKEIKERGRKWRKYEVVKISDSIEVKIVDRSKLEDI